MEDTNMINDIMSYVKNQFKNDSSGHDWWHTYRVYKLSTTIAQKENANVLLCQVAALLHDTVDKKLYTNIKIQYENIYQLLDRYNLSNDFIESVIEIIEHISFNGGKEHYSFPFIEGDIVRDADRLDSMGAIGIARTMCYSGHVGRPIHNPEILPRENLTAEIYHNGQDTAIVHFYEKLLKLKDLMITNAAKRIAKNRHDFLVMYLEEFLKEWDGIN